MNLGVAIPSYQPSNLAAYPLLMASRSERIEHLDYFENTGSLLALGFNQLWCWMLNSRPRMTHLLIMHADVRPRHHEWFEVFAAEMERANADILSAIIPIKSMVGLTSTALDTDYWSPQRLTTTQINERLPVTWTSPFLLFNTGLILIDVRKPWVEQIHFTINDAIMRDDAGVWTPRVESEDWNFARQCNRLGVRSFVTRKVPIEHHGVSTWQSDSVWGPPTDYQGLVANEKILVEDPEGEMLMFDAANVGEVLPRGWFTAGDIDFYRWIYKELIPAGGKAVEIGVYRGRSIMSVADIVREKQIQVSCIDHFLPDELDRDPARYDAFVERVQRAGLTANIDIIRGDSVTSAKRFRDGSLDFVFIDADHSYGAVKADINAFDSKRRPGAYMGGHDYGTDPGVTKAVDERFAIQTRADSSIWLTEHED